MAMKRMSREQFFGKLATLDEDRLRKILWNLYWRGTANMRERIEAELDPEQARERKRTSDKPADPERVLAEVRDFTALARSGAYMGGDRRVSPKERTRWRFTFQRLVTETLRALRAEDCAAGAAAVELLIDLACEMHDSDYFHSEDPVEAARFVVSDAAAQLWATLRERCGFRDFADRAAPQLIRWEAPFGWTRSGWGRLSEKETSLASVLEQMLRIPDTWIGFADCYLDALAEVECVEGGRPRSIHRTTERAREERTAALAGWHLCLLDRLAEYEAEDRLDRLVQHPALGGPELTFLQARLAYDRDDSDRALSLIHEALTRLPGHRRFIRFALEIGAPLPPRAQQIVNSAPHDFSQ